MFTPNHKTLFLHHRKHHRKSAEAAAAIATAAAEIRLSYVIINITIIEMKTKAAFKKQLMNTCQHQLLWL